MNIIQAIILGLVQGLTEFLPISSSGHLSVFQALFKLNEGNQLFDVAVHLATLIAVVSVFYKDVWEMVKRPFSKLTLLVVTATIPTVVIAIVFKDIIESAIESRYTLGFEFIFTGLVLLIAEKIKSKEKNLEETSYFDAIIVGIAQGIAILPAVSRSGLTLAGSLFRGLNRDFAMKFSFLISIPAILGAAVLESYKLLKVIKGGETINVELLPVGLGMIAAAVSGYFAIKFMLKVFSKVSFAVFSIYVFILGILIILDQIFTGFFFPKFIM